MARRLVALQVRTVSSYYMEQAIYHTQSLYKIQPASFHMRSGKSRAAAVQVMLASARCSS
jgi:hypothetical protein